MRTVVFIFYFIFSLLIKIPPMLRFKKMKKTLSPQEFALKVEKLSGDWAMGHIKVTGTRVKMTGEENLLPGRPVLYVSNHQSNVDIAILLAYVREPKGYVAKTEMLKVPLLRTWMKYLRCIFIDRDDLRSSAGAIIEGIKILKSGHSMVIFPEGTRSKSGVMGEFKEGAFKLAEKAKVPIIPLTINGSYKVMEANGNWIHPADVEFTIHPPIYTDDLTKEDFKTLPGKVREIIQSAL